jgi:hypothetical protein
MADKKESEKTLEMRVAELEDKLKGLQVTEEEMKVYNKVASLLGGGGGAGAAAPQGLEAAGVAALTPNPDACVIAQCVRACTINQCVRACTVVQQCIRSCVIQQCIRACTIRQCCIQDCINECGGGGGGFMGGGGFGTLGG